MENRSDKSKEIKSHFEKNTTDEYLRGNSSKIGIDLYAYHIIKKVNIKPGFKYLDIGCGDGKIMKRIMEIIPNCEIDGIDISEKLISKAKLNNNKSDFFVGNAATFKFNKQYHKIFSFSFLQYLSLDQIILMNSSLKNSLIKTEEEQIFHLSIPDARLKNIPGIIKLSRKKLGFFVAFYQIFTILKSSNTYSNDGSIFHHPNKIVQHSEKAFKCFLSCSDSYYRFDISFKINQ